MSCQEIENKILDYQENHLSPAQREEVETHLAGCAGCRAFARQLQQLDAALSASVKVPPLSADFNRHFGNGFKPRRRFCQKRSGPSASASCKPSSKQAWRESAGGRSRGAAC